MSSISRANARLLGRRNQSGGGFPMPGFQLPQIVIHAGLVVTFGVPRRVEQKVGNLRHRGDDSQQRAAGGFGGNQIAGGFHAVRGADTGTAEFHDQQVSHFPHGGAGTRACACLQIVPDSKRRYESRRGRPVPCATLLVFFAIGNSRPHYLQDFLFHLFLRKTGGIQIHRIRRLHQRRFRALPVAFVAL